MLARVRKKKILASVGVLLVILLVATAIAYAGPAPAPFKEPKRMCSWNGATDDPVKIYFQNTKPELVTLTPTPWLKPPLPKDPKKGDRCIYTGLATRANTANAGETIIFEGKVHNDCEKELTVKLFPRAYGKGPALGIVIDPDWVTVKPEVTTLEAGETVYFLVSVAIPKEADAGFYDGMIVIQAEDGPEQIEDYGVQVYKPLDEPVKKTFSVPEKSSKVIVTVAWNTGEKELYAEGMMDVQLYDPNNKQIAQETKMTRISGYVDTYRYMPFPVPEMPYEKAIAEGNEYVYESYTVMYQIENPVNGTWTLEMKPKNLMHFKYDIVVNPIGNLYR